MSNWSVVIVGWSGIDRKVPDHEDRFRRVVTRYAEIGLKPHPEEEPQGWVPHYTCGEEDRHPILGFACETIIVTHENYFMPSDMLQALGEFLWEKPEEVVVLEHGAIRPDTALPDRRRMAGLTPAPPSRPRPFEG